MKKLFIFQDNQDEYRDELECAYDKVLKNKERFVQSLSLRVPVV